MKTLIVEDDPADAEIVALALERMGMEVHFIDRAETLASARSKAAAIDYDLIILDLDLPDSPPNETIKAITVLKREAVVLVLSGHDDADTIASCSAAGSDAEWHKDVVGSHHFVGVVANLMRHSSSL